MSKGRKKGKRKSGRKSSGPKSNKRPLAFLKAMAFKMRKNLPKLEALIERRSKGGE